MHEENCARIAKTINSHIKNTNLIIDTVARVQGLTTDVCIFVIPNTNYLRSLEPRLFNVATSRSIIQTIIITDKEILDYSRMNINVRQYLENWNKTILSIVHITATKY